MQLQLMPDADLRNPEDPEAARRHLMLWVAFERARGADGDRNEESDRQVMSRARARHDADQKQMLSKGWRCWIPDADPRLARLGDDRPTLLFVAGTLDLKAPAVGVVGTRRPDAYGNTIATALGGALGRIGVNVVSGGALGIDRRAHESALDAGGTTTIVLGGGLGRPHPSTNRDLFDRAVATGSCVISEWPPPFPARAFTFPRRNRLVAALSDALVVVQAGAVSGALITAARARAAGVPCFAVPGDVWYERSAGALSLLATGAARPLGSPADLARVPGLEALAWAPWPRPGVRPWGLPGPWGATGIHGDTPADPGARAVLGALSDGPLGLDDLAAATGLDPGLLAAHLIDLEVAGALVRLPGGVVAVPSAGRPVG